jgi:glycosyltransferase involved in cell wall biosynthesis
MPKVSVVIPSYNSMAYLPETLESVLGQTFSDFEVLVINDGSSDHIVEWSSQIEDARVKLISQDNKGLAGARNTGIAEAQGEYVAFLDADDSWEPTKLEKQVYSLESNPAVGLVYTWTAYVDQLGIPTKRVIAFSAEGKVWEQVITKDIICNGSSAMVRHSCLKHVGEFDSDMHPVEDWDMWIRLAEHYPFSVVKEPLVYYRQHPNSLSKNRPSMIQGFTQVIEKAFRSAPLESLHLRGQSYGWLNFYQAWNSVNLEDYEEAVYYQQQALLHYPRLRYSENFMRLSLAITMMRWFGPQSYRGIKKLTHLLRQRILGIKL